MAKSTNSTLTKAAVKHVNKSTTKAKRVSPPSQTSDSDRLSVWQKRSFIKAAYILAENNQMSTVQTLQAIYQDFKVKLVPDDVYKARYALRNQGWMTPHDRTANLTERGVNQTIKEQARKVS